MEVLFFREMNESVDLHSNYGQICSKMESKDPLHGKTLEAILIYLVDQVGWKELSVLIPVNCFKNNPSVKSSLTFLRKTPWARRKVEELYIHLLR